MAVPPRTQRSMKDQRLKLNPFRVEDQAETCSRTSNCWQKKKTDDLYLTAMTTLTTNENRTPLGIVAAIVAISVIASLFLCWLVYYHAPADVTGTHLLFLPALNALSAVALVTGFCFIRARRVSEHRAAMFTAFVFCRSVLKS